MSGSTKVMVWAAASTIVDTESPLVQGFSQYAADVTTAEDDGRTRPTLHECCDSVHMWDRPHRDDVRCIDTWDLWQHGFRAHG